MSLKGKEKEVETVNVVSDGENEAANFFMKKRKRPVARPPSPILVSSSPEKKAGSDDDSDIEEAIVRKKAAKPKKKENNVVPEWAREMTSSSRAKRSGSATETKKAEKKGKGKQNGVINLASSSPEPETSAPTRQSELTPPPENSEEMNAQIAQAIQSAYQPPTQIPDDEEDTSKAASHGKPSEAAYEDAIRLNCRMVAPPERKADASAKAIEFYEKKRTVTAGRTQHLSFAFAAFAALIRKQPADIVFTHEGVRIFSGFLTPQRLNMEFEADLVCYEKAHWERIEVERTQRETLIDTGVAQEEQEETGSQSSEPVPETEKKVRFTLAGAQGDIQASVLPHVTAKSLCKYYVKKTNMDPSLAASMRLSWDGETIDPETKFEELDVDDGDQVDVIQV